MSGPWVYIRSEPQLHTVGFYDPNGAWHSDSDHSSQQDAADRVIALNGGGPRATPPAILETVASVVKRHKLEEIGTGGGCTAWYLRLNTEGAHVLVTDLGNAAPTDENCKPHEIILVGLYDGSEGEYASLLEVPLWHLGQVLDMIAAARVLPVDPPVVQPVRDSATSSAQVPEPPAQPLEPATDEQPHASGDRGLA